ncbi:UDP-4-amino-4,6-dideoxy-N-acetyl-beta-L-altrosamine N-acetyltransferase [Desulforamulus ruminis]|uniref:Pseudaminic acid biosynthesis N-acetyl transferase n=1 Tax=Desulforamulus ruminis (strain ATCC 23193 / DSM 2154 / NCIMB 8452 / DL) TaxID=696281 RepID=F6DNQ1_DESRL|nr:UDP-4-amino-4,6-dideoxy-N-acetyl-beta-L-altrosamine N-acetyltransferase [Desulforamulus ruminis]AEG59496.1 pseudaminic acid biosynthesis N-acetyl transferase [Desulforamulus ruminis DSM 2154]
MSHFGTYRLRPMKEKDLEKVLGWRNSERIRSNMFSSHIITLDEHRAWFKSLTQKKKDIYMIFERENLPLGVVYFTNINFINNTCNWGFYLGEENLPKGTGLIMGYLGINYAFEDLKMNLLSGEVLSFNIPSINYHKKLGFVKKNSSKSKILREGRYYEVTCFDISKNRWEFEKRKLKYFLTVGDKL